MTGPRRYLPILAAASLFAALLTAPGAGRAQVYVSVNTSVQHFTVPATGKSKQNLLALGLKPQYERDLPCPEIWDREARAIALNAEAAQYLVDQKKAAAVGDLKTVEALSAKVRAVERRSRANTLVMAVLKRQVWQDEVFLIPDNSLPLFVLGQSHPHRLPHPLGAVQVHGVKLAAPVPVFVRAANDVQVPPSSVFAEVNGPVAPLTTANLPAEYIDLSTFRSSSYECKSDFQSPTFPKSGCGLIEKVSARVNVTAGAYCAASAPGQGALLAFTLRFDAAELGPDPFVVTYRLGYAAATPAPGGPDLLARKTTNLAIDRYVRPFLEDALGSRQSFRIDDRAISPFVRNGSTIAALRKALGQVNDTLSRASPPVTDSSLTAYFAANNERYVDGSYGEAVFVLRSGDAEVQMSLARVYGSTTVESISLNGTKIY